MGHDSPGYVPHNSPGSATSTLSGEIDANVSAGVHFRMLSWAGFEGADDGSLA